MGVEAVLVNGHNGWRTDPLYTLPEAAHLAKVHPTTVKRWLYGYETLDREAQPIFGEQAQPTQPDASVSFLQLAEIVVASSFRRHGLKLERIRRAHAFAKEMWDLEYPFARLALESLGGHVIRRFEEEQPGPSLLVLDDPAQLALPGMVLETLNNFDYHLELASRWFPVGKDIRIVIDPRYSAGLPTIPDRRVTVGAIRRRFLAGHSIRFIAGDLKLNRDLVEEAVPYGERVAA